MRIVIAPDKFKGSLPAAQVAELDAGLRRWAAVVAAAAGTAARCCAGQPG